MSKFYVEKFVKAPVRVMVEANDEFEALHNAVNGDWNTFEYGNDADDYAVEGIKGIEASECDYTTVYDENCDEVRSMANDVAAGYIE